MKYRVNRERCFLDWFPQFAICFLSSFPFSLSPSFSLCSCSLISSSN
uniref:Uncharacterized protein n=1 Tax=Rhizophora mucronata TaxID=61149 RepID=A0A2P2QIH7_RHIMU